MHPAIEYSDAKLDHLLKALDTAFVNVIEFRHESWYNQSVVKALKNSGITFCSISLAYPTMYTKKQPLLCTAGFMVFQNFTFLPCTDKELKKIANDINRKKGIDDVYIYFNNYIKVVAVKNAWAISSVVEY